MTPTLGIVLVFFASFLWGTWLQARKFTGEFPLTSFMVWLYFSSMLLVWIVIGITSMIIRVNFISQIQEDLLRAFLVTLCGAGLAIGMYLQMYIIDKVGLVLANSVSATFGVILGTTLSVIIGGLPETVSVGLVIMSVIVLITATFLCQFSGKMRDEDLKKRSFRPAVAQDTKSVFILILSSLLITSYPLGMSIGVKTNFSESGFTSLTCVGLLSLGSFIGILLFCAIPLTRRREWKTLVSRKYKKEIGVSCICGVCHYGGNLIHIVTSQVLSVAISWLLGRLGNMWTYLWGIAHREYYGARRKTYIVLASGIGVYLFGILLLAQGMYR